MSACGGLYLLDTGSVTPDSIRGRYDGDDAWPPALIPKLTDNSEHLFRHPFLCAAADGSGEIEYTAAAHPTETNQPLLRPA